MISTRLLMVATTTYKVTTRALFDSRTTGLIIHPEFVREHRFKIIKLDQAIPVRNMGELDLTTKLDTRWR